jgi:hypothetical protein
MAADVPAGGTVGAPWLVCHTKPRCEKKFAALMAAEKFGHYLPLVESVRRYGQQTKRFTKPLFPGYVFATRARWSEGADLPAGPSGTGHPGRRRGDLPAPARG